MVTGSGPAPATAEAGLRLVIPSPETPAVTVNSPGEEAPAMQPVTAGCTTRTDWDAGLASNVAGTVTVMLLEVTDEGVNGVPAQSTVAAAQKPWPEMVTDSAGAPAAAEKGLRPLMSEGKISYVAGLDEPGLHPVTAGLVIVMVAAPGDAVCVADTSTVRRPELMNVTASGLPFHRTAV
jgi:hypothetical protein